MVVLVIFIFLMLLCSVVSIVLARYIASGGGDGLIAGYGVASNDDKEKYDVKRVRKVTAISLYFVAAMLPLFGITAFLPKDSAMIAILLLTVVTIAALVCGAICGDKWSRKK